MNIGEIIILVFIIGLIIGFLIGIAPKVRHYINKIENNWKKIEDWNDRHL